MQSANNIMKLFPFQLYEYGRVHIRINQNQLLGIAVYSRRMFLNQGEQTKKLANLDRFSIDQCNKISTTTIQKKARR